MVPDPSTPTSEEAEPSFGARVAVIVLTLQVLALLAYAVLHSPAVQPLTRLLHLRRPGFCYFVCP